MPITGGCCSEQILALEIDAVQSCTMWHLEDFLADLAKDVASDEPWDLKDAMAAAKKFDANCTQDIWNEQPTEQFEMEAGA